MCDLFEETSEEIGQSLGFPCDREEARNSRGYLEYVRELAGLRGTYRPDRRDLEAVRRIADLLSSLWVKLIPDVDQTLMEKDCVITVDAILLETGKSWLNLVKLCLDDLSADLIQVW